MLPITAEPQGRQGRTLHYATASLLPEGQGCAYRATSTKHCFQRRRCAEPIAQR